MDVDTANTIYKLRKVIHAHTGDVRCLHNYLDGFVSGSRDTKAKVWLPAKDDPNDVNNFHEVTTFSGPTHYVSCIVSGKVSSGELVIFVGSNDGNIYCYTEEVKEPKVVLKSHQGTVCSLAISSKGQLLSGSWDTTARLWQGNCGAINQASICLEGHTAAVWAVAFLTDVSTLTASADKSIKQWNSAGACLRTFNGHEDVVRGIAVLNETSFLTVSNDTTIKQWTPSSLVAVNTFHGHENYIYDIVILPPAIDGSFRFVTCSEDRTARVWLRDHVSQTIRLPATTLWSVCTVGDSDIAIGASNGTIYVYTTNDTFVASEEEIKLLEEEVSKTSIPVQELGGVSVDSLPTVDSLLTTPGTRDGQTKIVKEGKSMWAYQWSSLSNNWIKVGEVTGSADSASKDPSQKMSYEGKEYDYVFSIDIEDGVPPLKLPFNVTDNPWDTAQQFIHKHELSQAYLDQIANFIIKNAEGVTTGVTINESAAYDPFTGGNRYVPGTDPNTSKKNGVDTSAAKKTITESGDNPYFPVKNYVCFETVKLEPIVRKILEFSKQVPPELAVTEEDIKLLLELTDVEKEVTLKQIRLLKTMLTWPKSYIFPILDLIRVALLLPKVNQELVFAKDAARFLDTLLVSVSDTSSIPNQLTSLKALCNLFANPSGETFADQHMATVLKVISSPNVSNVSNVTVLNALATLYINYATLLNRKKADSITKIDCLSNVTSLIASRGKELATNDAVDPLYRLMVALGILINEDNELTSITKAGNIAEQISTFNTHSVEKVKGCSLVLCKMLN